MNKYLNNLEVSRDILSFAEETRYKYVEKLTQKLFADPEKMQKMISIVLTYGLKQLEERINKEENPAVQIKVDDFRYVKEFKGINEHEFAVIVKTVEELYKDELFGYRMIAVDAKLLLYIDIVY